MRFLIYIMLMVVAINAQPLDVTQVFNKKTIKVVKKEVNLSKTFYGDVTIPDNAKKDINIRFNGFIDKVYANTTFMYIKKGEKLFDIYSDEINLAMNELLLRDTKLRKSYLEKFKSFNINSKVINDLIKNEKVKEYINIYSPYEGFLISKKINDGSFAKKGETLFQIANFEKLWVIAKVYQKNLKFIQKDMRAKINIDGVGVLNSKVDFIYPSIDIKDKTIRVRFEIDNKDLKVFPNMFAKVSINTLQKTMLVLPKSAVLTKADKHFVFIPNGNSFEPKEITATRINSEEFEVIGLNENDVVIDKAMFLLDSDAITNGLYGSSNEDEEW